MNDHPHELLADYVDGELPADRRAEVEAHLTACPTCTEEVALAREARGALQALPEVPAPTGLAELPLRLRREARRPSRAGRWIAAAAAAALVGAGAIVILRQPIGVGGGDAGQGGGAAEGGAGPAAGPMAPGDGEPDQAEGQRSALAEATDPSAVDFVETGRNYDPAALARLAPRLRAQAEAALRKGFPRTTERFFLELTLDQVPGPSRRAIRCASEGLPPDQPAAPFRIEAARFQGEPVYVAAFLRGPDAFAPHDRILIWVVSREACTLRYFASQKL
jgi:Putative zinc-finger